MTSVLTAQPGSIKRSRNVAPTAPDMNQTQEPTPPQASKQDDDMDKYSHGGPGEGSVSDQAGDDDARNGHTSNSEEGPAAKKRRRSRKGLDKKFECPTEGCGKSYSRAEHLYRHQLNHSPKQIFQCDFPDCNRTFVRQDLCNRHMDRHTAKNSSLGRRESIGQGSPDATRPHLPVGGSASPEGHRPSATSYSRLQSQPQYRSPQDVGGRPFTPMDSTPPSAFGLGTNNATGYGHQESGFGGFNGTQHAQQSPAAAHRTTGQTSSGNYGVLSPISTQQSGYHTQPINTPQSSTTTPFVSQQNFPPFTLPPAEYANTSTSAMTNDNGHSYVPTTSGDFHDQSRAESSGERMLLDQMAAQTTIPVFGSDGFQNKSPYISIPEDFVAYLFNTTSAAGSPTMGHVLPHNQYAGYGDQNQQQYSMPYLGADHLSLSGFPHANQPQQVMAVNNLLDANPPESLLSEEKSLEIYEYIRDRFHESDHAPVDRQRDIILSGDRSDENHMLSRKMMQQYIGSYWAHFSDQVPILHKPTFSPGNTPTLLLLAVMSIGSACLDRTHGHKVTRAGAQLSNFLAWHLRWEIFMDVSFRPPAKLWAFQAVILLELYEKMYSTRELHERAHIHHATTITLMRRGRSLIGKSALDSPPNPRDDRRDSSAGANQPDEWWNHWIINETTRRTAFAAFLIDSIHATMFGHSTVMVAHEMRLPLPCDDKLWKAANGAEVGRIDSRLQGEGIKAISFLEGLKRTLAGHEVVTNTFGRQILMAGLLSVSWHMNQRDLQVHSLGVSAALGGRDKWRSTLTRAFDSWKTDFDKSLARSEVFADPYGHDRRNKANVVFESRTVLHHLAHMAMHVDIVDCQIFARAKRLLGRAIGQPDLNSAQRRMKEVWAPSAKARDATYYALSFLCSVLAPGLGRTESHGDLGNTEYCARDDVLLNRPWVLYFAALVVWCYGYALEGPCSHIPLPTTHAEKVGQMRSYLHRLGSVQSPEDLKSIQGVNQNSALLMVLRDSFESTRWELLHEGANLLRNCIHLNTGGTV